MDELVKMVTQKTGISQDQARQAIDVVMNYLKGKLPANMSSMLDSVMKGQAPNMGDVQSGLGGMFGKK
jgi:nucleoid DNA-binding protein